MSDRTALEIARVERAIPKVSTMAGVFVRMEDGLAVVNVGTETLRLQTEGWSPPLAGMPVRIEALNGSHRVTGPNVNLSPSGVVTAVDGLLVDVDVEGISYTLPVLDPYSPIEGDVVVIDWRRPIVLGEESTAPSVVEPPTNTGGSQAFSDLIVQATSSGRYFGGTLRGDEVWASPSNDGAWFYSGRLGALQGANITRAEIYLPLFFDANYGGGDLVQIARHGIQDRSGSTPSFSANTTLSPESGWVALPSGWGNHFRDNPSNGVGVTVPSSGFFKWQSVGADPLSGALRFAGTR